MNNVKKNRRFGSGGRPLGTKQEAFKEEQEKRMSKALREVILFKGMDTQEWVEMLRRLKMEVSSAGLTQAIMWMENKRKAAQAGKDTGPVQI